MRLSDAGPLALVVLNLLLLSALLIGAALGLTALVRRVRGQSPPAGAPAEPRPTKSRQRRRGPRPLELCGAALVVLGVVLVLVGLLRR